MNTFGVEIEFLVPNSTNYIDVAQALSRASRLPVLAANRAMRSSSWKLTHDGSVSAPGRLGLEAVSPVLTEDKMDQIDKICSALSTVGAVVNRSCGLHVHIGAGSMPLDAIKRLAILYAESELFIDQLLPPSRRGSNNNYCKSVRSHLRLQNVLRASNVAGVAQSIASGDRYLKLNLTSFWRHGTVEFRQHSGTIDPDKIKNWVRFCQHLVATALRETAAQGPLQSTETDAASPTVGSQPAPGSYWNSGRRTRIMFRMLTRPEGATPNEIRLALDVRVAPAIAVYLARAAYEGTQFGIIGSRGGERVWGLRSRNELTTPTAATVAAPLRIEAPTSLEALLDRLQVPAVERTYWVERAALLNEPAA